MRHNLLKLAVFTLTMPLMALFTTGAYAGVAGSTAETNTDSHGLALHGYDPVAYFVTGKPTPGNGKISASYGNIHYFFVNEADRKLFVTNPEKYLPQYGGFCAVGTAYGHKVDTDPATGVVVNGKLYLNYNAKASAIFKKDPTGIIDSANSNWPKVKDQAL
jgi:YHS domain-containing protein